MNENFEEVLSEERWDKVPGWECLYLQRKKWLISINVRGYFENTGNIGKFEPDVEKLMSKVDLEEPTKYTSQKNCNSKARVVHKNLFHSARLPSSTRTASPTLHHGVTT